MDQAKTKLLKLDATTKDFTAHGTHYTVEEDISQDRWADYLKTYPQLAFGITFPELFKAFREIFDFCNEQNMAEIAVISRDKMKGIETVSLGRIDPALRICALFINTDDEDRRWITEEQIKKKIEDWRQEGISMSSFFQLALHTIPGFMESFTAITQGISQQE